jgi:hypothetical protein
MFSGVVVGLSARRIYYTTHPSPNKPWNQRGDKYGKRLAIHSRVDQNRLG